MLRIALVNMPFADWHRPSFALSQLASLARREFGDEVETDVVHLNQDMAEYFGVPLYTALAGNIEHLTTGLGDWLFRDMAFPDLPENSAEYFRRYYVGRRWDEFREHIAELRDGLPGFCAELVERHDLASYDVVGFTSMFAQTAGSVALARMIKQRNPAAVTVIGGANCEPPMGRELAAGVPVLDFVFQGPALHTFPALVRHLLDGDAAGLHAIPGILSERNCADPRYTASVGRERDIDDYIEPDYDSFVASLRGNAELTAAIDAGTQPILYFETSRGCWWGERSHCTFCGLNGLTMKYRVMDAALARRQLNRLFTYAPWCTTYACTDNIMPKHYPRDVFDHLSPPAGASIFYEIKVPVADRDMKLMARSGVNRVQPGIEALSTDTLTLMGKGTTAFQNIQFLKSCSRYDVEPVWNLLVGFPGEEESVYRGYEENLPLLFHLPPPSGAFMVRFDRYSPYFTKAAEYGLKLRPMAYYRLIYPFGEAGLENFAYFFADERLAPYQLAAIKWLEPLNEMARQWTARWQDAGAEPPCLTLTTGRDGHGHIRDTRDGSPREYEIDAEDVAILHRLSSPLRPERLAAFLDRDTADVAARLDALRERSLLFEEGGRALSLVMTEDVTSEDAAPHDLLEIHPV